MLPVKGFTGFDGNEYDGTDFNDTVLADVFCAKHAIAMFATGRKIQSGVLLQHKLD